MTNGPTDCPTVLVGGRQGGTVRNVTATNHFSKRGVQFAREKRREEGGGGREREEEGGGGGEREKRRREGEERERG